MLILGKDEAYDHFHGILVANIQHWGYEAVLVSASVLYDPQVRQGVEGDILLYDMDALPQYVVGLGSADSEKVPSPGVTQLLDKLVWPRVRLIIALGNRSVSRLSLERMGAIALLYKPFDMRHLERYLRVFQKLLYAETTPGEVLAMSERVSFLSEGEESVEALSPTPARILVADDRQDMTRMICQCLIEQSNQRYHFEVKEAHDGLELLEQCLAWRPHCVVTDLLMPWLNGYQVIRCLADSGIQPSPTFVVISALMQHEIPADHSYLRDQVILYVDKPFDVENLLAVIEQALAQ